MKIRSAKSILTLDFLWGFLSIAILYGYSHCHPIEYLSRSYIMLSVCLYRPRGAEDKWSKKYTYPRLFCFKFFQHLYYSNITTTIVLDIYSMAVRYCVRVCNGRVSLKISISKSKLTLDFFGSDKVNLP